MKKTMRELIEMIDNGTLHYDHSTQRKFIYATEMVKLAEGGTISKSGSVIYSILELGIKLPGVFFWHNTDTGDLNIHDGKQRILSLYYFITGKGNYNINTLRHGKPIANFDALDEADQKKLLDYTFSIEENTGTSEEEERSFDAINSNAMNLTAYECLYGLLHGEWLSSFEDYIAQKAKIYDCVTPIGKDRGDQAYNFLLTMFGIKDSKKSAYNDPARLNLRNAIRPLRHLQFNPADFNFDEILELFAELSKMKFGNAKGKTAALTEETALAVAAYIIRNYRVQTSVVLDLYRRSSKVQNDIAAWANDFNKTSLQTHKTFIDKYMLEQIELDPTRYFSEEVKRELYKKDQCCAHVNPITGQRDCHEDSYNALEVDHIVAWSKSGRTNPANAQLLCKHHNTSKNND